MNKYGVATALVCLLVWACIGTVCCGKRPPVDGSGILGCSGLTFPNSTQVCDAGYCHCTWDAPLSCWDVWDLCVVNGDNNFHHAWVPEMLLVCGPVLGPWASSLEPPGCSISQFIILTKT